MKLSATVAAWLECSMHEAQAGGVWDEIYLAVGVIEVDIEKAQERWADDTVGILRITGRRSTKAPEVAEVHVAQGEIVDFHRSRIEKAARTA